MTSPAQRLAFVRPAPSRTQRSILAAIALAPLAVGMLLWIAAPAFLAPLWDNRVAMAGLPLGLWLIAVFALATASAVLVALTVRSTLAAGLTVLLFAGLSLYLVLLSPAVVLVVIALGNT